MVNQINQIDFNQEYTFADYLTWKFSERVELIKGKLFKMSPAPNLYHQQVSGAIFNQLYNFFANQKCQVFSAPFDVRFPKNKTEVADIAINDVVQPDICVICDVSKLDTRGCLGAPDLIVEILSLRTNKKDLNDKKNLYEKNQVQEYWVVHPTDGTLLQYSLEADQYQFKGVYTTGDTVISTAIEGLNLTLIKIFPEEL